jgi:hypothetical protein
MQKDEQIIYLLRGEHYLFLKAIDDTKASSFKYSIPLNYGDQVPILIKVDGDFLSYKIIDYKLKPNQVIHFELPPMKKNEKKKIHFEYWILTFNTMHKNLPSKKNFPQLNDLPEDVKKWLIPTKSVQSNNFLIKIMANILKGTSRDMLWFAKKIAFWIAYHGLITIRLKMSMVFNPYLNKYILPEKYAWYLEDAISTLLFGALCAGRANLIAALLRSKGIPARIVVTTPTTRGKDFWLDSQHYTVEFYCPEHGWIRTQAGSMPHLSKYIIPIRIVSPEEENIAGGPFSIYGGMALGFWSDNENIIFDWPPEEFRSYKHHKSKKVGIPATRGWIDCKLKIPSNISDKIHKLSNEVWMLLSKNSRINEKKVMTKAVELQEKAIMHLRDLKFEKYIEFMKKSKEEHLKISDDYYQNK